MATRCASAAKLRRRSRTIASALQRAPAHAGARNNLGLALEASGERDAAERCYREVLAQEPAHADAWGNLARMLFERERFADAAAAYARLAAVRRELPPAVWVERAIAQQASGDLPAAEASFREAARLAPDLCAIQLNLGTVCADQRRYAEAEPAWLRALEIEPHNLYALSMLAHGRQQRCDWRGLEAIFAETNRLLEAGDANGRAGSHASPFALLSMPTSLRARLLGGKTLGARVCRAATGAGAGGRAARRASRCGSASCLRISASTRWHRCGWNAGNASIRRASRPSATPSTRPTRERPGHASRDRSRISAT